MFRFFQVLAVSALLVLISAPASMAADELSEASEWQHTTSRLVHDLVGDDTLAFLGFQPSLHVFPHPVPHASVDAAGTIHISDGMFQLLKSRTEYAFLLAHELGHVVLHHHRSSGDTQAITGSHPLHHSLDDELHADEFAIQLLKGAGFEPSAGAALLSRLDRFGEDQGAPLGELYPSLKSRVQALQTAQ